MQDAFPFFALTLSRSIKNKKSVALEIAAIWVMLTNHRSYMLKEFTARIALANLAYRVNALRQSSI